ncbi:MAG: hypothetical protein EOM84_03985 [Sphingobacteriia bacterium]|nr:hypothetical protein [Sphingobacteriia bacterium]
MADKNNRGVRAKKIRVGSNSKIQNKKINPENVRTSATGVSSTNKIIAPAQIKIAVKKSFNIDPLPFFCECLK